MVLAIGSTACAKPHGINPYFPCTSLYLAMSGWAEKSPTLKNQAQAWLGPANAQKAR
jgi:hypothetical protein